MLSLLLSFSPLLPFLLFRSSTFPYFLLYFLSHTLHSLFWVVLCPLFHSSVSFCSHSQSKISGGRRPVMSPGRVPWSKPFRALTSWVEFCSFKQPLLKLIRNAISALLAPVWLIPAASSALENIDLSYQQSWANKKPSARTYCIAPCS